MNGFLLDTNHASHLLDRRSRLRPRLLVRPGAFHLCPVVLSEVRYGLVRKKRTRMLTEWSRLAALFARLPLDEEDAVRAADLRAQQEGSGRRLELPDALIAAVALRHGLTLLTADGDFNAVPGLTVED